MKLAITAVLMFVAAIWGFFMGSIAQTNTPAALESIATPIPTATPYVLYKDRDVYKEPRMEYRCVLMPVLVPTNTGLVYGMGETALCGYNLRGTGIYGPTIAAHDPSGISWDNIGYTIDILAHIKAQERKCLDDPNIAGC